MCEESVKSLGAVQLLGGALVLGAAVVLTASARRSPQQNTATLNGKSVGVPAEL